MFALVLAAVVVGAVAQRISGLGFALVVSPVLVLALGAFDGVMLVNLCAAVSASMALLLVRRDVDWRRYAALAGCALVGIVPGAWLAASLPGPVVEISIGVLLVVALTISVLLTRTSVVLSGPLTLATSGVASGLMNAAAGIGGPAVSVYALLSRWPHRSFAATLQPYFLTLGLCSLGAKWVASGGRMPGLEPWQWVTIIACTAGGLLLGQRIAPHVPAAAARRIVVAIAYLGAASLLVKGLTDL
ncbi:sulfite exporter TauE/SafE family protein [Tersicoccus solisilvae]|uniref:sulfite exporter TauE/SafE family protein n=1 Tax=Tersicoccus solisilvae TaxID=1882339 RepID=UPI001667E6C4|nr:sulfite exporter TauE/SafE family protein [Tersicoccus solisilvae]